MANDIVVKSDVTEVTLVSGMIGKIRPQWQSKSLIQRVKALLQVDPSSACQRLLNASIHDLKEKIVIAGIDIASEAAIQNKLPPISKEEDIENYSTQKLIDLAYYMGLFSRPEWRRVSRCYEIRRDLEHEDDEYLASPEDCFYIFTTCIEVILSVDPVHLLKVKDVKDVIEQAEAVVPDESLLSDYERAPQPRQEQICKFLLNVTLDKAQPDIVQKNAYVFISHLKSRTHKQVSLKLGGYLQEKVGRKPIEERLARVAQAAGVFSFLRQTARKDFFEKVYEEFESAGTGWSAYDEHGEILRSFIEYGGFAACPPELHLKFIKWLVLTYIGTPGGVTSYGNLRHVYYSNTAAPIIRDIFESYPDAIREHLLSLRTDEKVANRLENPHIARRYESLIDLVE